MRAAVAGALITLCVTAAGAQQQDIASARAVLPGCKYYVALADAQNSELTGPMALAAGYCAAVFDVLMATSALDPFLCPDSGIDRTTGMLVLIRYIEAKPQRMRERFLGLAREAMRQAWPCVHSFGRQ